MSNSKISNYIKDVWNILNDIEDIDVVDKGDSCILTISNHEPLDKIFCVYDVHNRLWTKEYILKFQIIVKKKDMCIHGHIDLSYKNGKILWKANENCKDISDELTCNRMLTDKVGQLLDMGGKITIKFDSDEARIDVSAIPGSIIKMYIPPAVHLIKPEISELILILQIMQLITKSINNVIDIG